MDTKNFEWTTFLQPYEFALTNFLTKLQFIKKQYTTQGLKNPIEDITGRLKSPASIIEKLERLNMDISDVRDITDIAGVRITCKYIQDVYQIYDILKSRKDIKIVLVKDYIKYPKPSGYRSLHLIAKYNAETINGQMPVYMEFQIRTLAMHLWASIEHSLKYKYYLNIPQSLRNRLTEASKIAYDLDVEMSKIKSDMDSFEEDEERKPIEEKYLNNWFKLNN
ncbi:MAG: GTP pyrophosphokinase family protein [Bacilli bacterium]|nr:GTP pyrophosphokinase family protein [Bacilli bacterium]